MLLTNMGNVSKSVYLAGRNFYAMRTAKGRMKRKSPIGVYVQLFYASYLLGCTVSELIQKPYPSLRVIKHGLDNRVYMKVMHKKYLLADRQVEGIIPIFNEYDALMFKHLINFAHDDAITLDFSKLNTVGYPRNIVVLYRNLKQFFELLYVQNPPTGQKEYGFAVLKKLRIYDLMVNNNMDAEFVLGKKHLNIKGEIGKELSKHFETISPENLLFRGVPNSMSWLQLSNTDASTVRL